MASFTNLWSGSPDRGQFKASSDPESDELVAMRSCCCLFGLLLLLGAAQASWLPVRLESNRWTAVREARPGQFWLRPQCRLQASDKSGCNNEWLVTVRFWSWGLISRVQRALESTDACRNATCVVSPFQAARLGLQDQTAQWVADEVRFVNGPLPAAVQFRLRPRPAVTNCSFRASSLVVELQGGMAAAAIFGFEVRSAFRALQPLRWDLSVERVTQRLAQSLLRQRAADASPGAVQRLQRVLMDWAAWQHLVEQRQAPSNRSRSAAVFARFPPLAQLRAGGATPTAEVLRFSVLPERRREQQEEEKPQTSPRPQPTQAQQEDALAALQRRLSALEAALAARPRQQPGNSGRPAAGRASSGAAAEIDSCTGVGPGVFRLRPTGRHVRCSSRGELLVLYRRAGNVLFNRSFDDYRRGFGDARKGDYWLGLDFLANYTARGDICARVRLTPWRLKLREASIQYSDFEVASRARGYRLWYTANSSSSGIADALRENRGRSFSTFDRDRDAFIGNCAQIFGGGGWFHSCTRANIFGKMDVLSSRCMCWRGVPSQGDMCAPLTGISLALRKASHGKGAKKIVFSLIANGSVPATPAPTRASLPSWCQPELQRVVIKGTGRYTLTVAGAPGGRSSEGVLGGRGALVRAQLVLKAGTTLAVVAGCPGEDGSMCGHGGDASWIVDVASRSLLVAAGGGGGGGQGTRGRHGSASENGENANEIYSNETLTLDRILAKNIKSRGLGWRQVMDQLLRSSGPVSSGAKSIIQITSSEKYYSHGYGYYRTRYRYTYKNADVLGGGGGGGFEGGISGDDVAAGGGGGGSFCRPSAESACEVERGGNLHNTGFVLIEKQTCF